ncbi:MAG TPA: low temperature requirement protein A [Oligoflexia bacterium]|nr:low temperature requirement protein A [Oligoflexia bacterium]
MSMQNKMIHSPIFHMGHSPIEKKAGWLELFYDLIYVVSFIQLGAMLLEKISITRFGLTSFLFIAFWISWTGYSFYSNRYTLDDVPHRLLVFIHMFCVAAMTVLLPKVFQGKPAPFALIFAFSQLLIAAMHVRSYMQTDFGRQYTRFWGVVFFCSACFWVIGSFFQGLLFWFFSMCGLLTVLISPLLGKARTLASEFPIDLEHIRERYGLLTIIVLGESFVKVVGELSHHQTGIHLMFQACFALLLTCAAWWIYFDDVADSEIREQRFSMPFWLLGHIPLQFGIVCMGLGIKKAILADFSSPLPFAYASLLTFSIATVLLANGLIDTVTIRKNSEVNNNIRVYLRFISGFMFLLLGLISQKIPNVGLLWLCLGLMLLQIIIDIAFSPYKLSKEAIHQSKNLSEVEHTSKHIRKQTELRPVRKGIPNSLRNDLYYVFVNASWPVVFLCIFILYILSNVGFALLYMIVSLPESGETIGFFEAFFFSIQTMTTIGYGVLSPQGFYADLLVTVEAAFGLIGVALITGALFSKISKPASKLLFSDKVIISKFDGVQCLSFRVGNARGSDLVEAKVNVTLGVDEVTKEGEHMRRFYDLPLKRSRSSYFSLSWSIFHEINESSPLNKYNPQHKDFRSIIVTLTGHDGAYSNTVFARHAYVKDDIVYDRYFEDILSRMTDGRIMIDYDKFHQLKA